MTKKKVPLSLIIPSGHAAKQADLAFKMNFYHNLKAEMSYITLGIDKSLGYSQ